VVCVAERLSTVPEIKNMEPIAADRHGKPTLIKPRLGQGAFRLTITDSYERRCAVTGEKTLPILDAAHIRAFEASIDTVGPPRLVR
jgi:putative restriction endonuclease